MPNTGFDNSPGFSENLVNNVASNVSGIFSLRPNAKFMSGARCTLKINGKLVGFAFGISWTINTMVTEINTVDDYLPYELAPQRVTVEGTISALHIPGVSANTEGWQPNVLSFLFAPYISIEARDEATNQIIFATDKAMVVTRSEELRVEQLSNVTIRWRAIGYIDEQTPTPLHNYNQPNNNLNSPPTSQTNPVTSAISGAASAIANAVGL
jgi:hypothetical protein